MSNTNQQKSFSDYLNGIIINSLKAVKDNTVNISYTDNNLFAIDENSDEGIFVSNTNKMVMGIILETAMKSAYNQNAVDKIQNISHNSVDAVGLSVQKKWLEDSIKEWQKNTKQVNGAEKDIYQKTINELYIKLDVVNNKIKEKLSAMNLGKMDVSNMTPEDIAQKALAKDLEIHAEDIGGKIFSNLGHLFNAGTFVFLLSNKINTENTEELVDRATYVANWATSTTLAIFPKWDVPFDDGAFKLLNHIKSLSYPNLTALAARGVITGIATDIAFKLGYWFGEEVLWGKFFKDTFGQELYEMDWFLNLSESAYSTIFSHLTADKLNAVIVFNTMMLGNFVNAQGKSVIMGDTTILFGSDDYKEMDFDKALKNYKAIYKAITGKEDAKDIKDEVAMLKHMEGSHKEFRALKGQKLIIAQDGTDINEFGKMALENSNNALAYRYALTNLNPFVLEGADYAKHNQNGALELHSKDNPNGLTQIHLEKRAEMMSVMIDKMTGKFIQNKYNYQDLHENISINETSLDGHHGNIDTYNDNTQVIFGGTGNDTIKAKDVGDNNNFLFGGKGNDILDGGKGNDYLEGGVDFDTYHIKDHDTIYDADGKGKILFDGKQLPKDFIRHLTTNIWYAKDASGNILYTAIKEDNDLTITSTHSPNDKATLKDFFTTATKRGTTYSALSIVLADTQEDANKYGIYALKASDEYFSNIYVGGFPSEHLQITGSVLIDNVYSFGSNHKYLDVDTGDGNDLIFGGRLDDVLRGGSGNDLISGSSVSLDFEPSDSNLLPKPTKEGESIDKDLIIGGVGNDLLSGGVGNDVIWADNDYAINKDISPDKDKNNPNNAHNDENKEKGDWVLGGRGNDIIHGSVGRDFLQGGGDSDTIYGGGGDDVILGDGHIRFNQDSKVDIDLSVIDYTTNHTSTPLSYTNGSNPMPTTITPVVINGKLSSVEYLYDKGRQVDKKLPSASYREPSMFKWDTKIDEEALDYIFTPQENIKPMYDYHLLPIEHAGHNPSDFLYGGVGNDLIVGQHGNDALYGGEGNDILWGDDNRDLSISGSDFLNGGTGRDTLIGGLGFDTYDFKLEDLRTYGSDDKIIRDEDNQGRIVIGGVDLTGMEFLKIPNASNVYQTQDGTLELIRYDDKNYRLTSTEFNGAIYIKDTPTTNGTILGMVLSAEVKNTPPFAYGLPNKTIFAGEDVNIDLSHSFIDVEDPEDKLIYSLTGLSNATGLGFDQTLKSIIGTAPESGIFHLTLSATDTKGLTGNSNFMLGVNPKDPNDPSKWIPITLMNPPLAHPPKNKIGGVDFYGATNTRTSLMADESNTSTATTETTLPTLKQLGLVKEEEIGVELGFDIKTEFGIKTQEGLMSMADNHKQSINHKDALPTTTINPESMVVPSYALMTDKVQEVGVMGV